MIRNCAFYASKQLFTERRNLRGNWFKSDFSLDLHSLNVYSQKCNSLSRNTDTELFSRCFVLGPFCQTLTKAVFPSRVINASLYASYYVGQVNVLLSRVRYRKVVVGVDEIIVR